MIPEIGQLALILALLLALVQATLPVIGAQRGDVRWMALARPVARGQFAFVAIAFACLATAFLQNDFSVLNVASHSNSQLPAQYRFAASWGSHEGSILLWVLMLGGWTFAVSLASAHLPLAMVARVIGVMGMVSAGLLLFVLLTSNPFERLLPAAPDGRDLNPLLQDPGMVLHPPMLYMGYVGFSVAFAFAIAALLGGRLDAAWARWSRPWTTAAWCFLTLGIMIGSWWAYYELGWGGWWFWDPVENASFMPWLVGTALIHSLAVTEKRGAFRSWTVLLAIIAFALSLLGTFLVRSGVLTSVHAFATDPKRGVFILAFLAIVIGGSFALFAARAPRVASEGRFASVSRESLLLANNVLLIVATGAVLLGTLYPLAIDALGLGKLSVGPPYFDAVFVPIMAPLAFLIGVGPIARWKQAAVGELWLRLRWALAVSVVAGLVACFASGGWRPLTGVGIALACWIAVTSVIQVKDRIRHLGGGLTSRLASQPRAFWGMTAAHFGLAVFIVGVTMVKSFETERDVRLAPGGEVALDALTVRFERLREITGPNYRGVRGTFTLLEDGRAIATLEPEKRLYNAGGMPMTEAAIRRSLLGDVYVSLGEEVGTTAWIVRVYSKPFINWIWAGCMLMALGGFLALADRRYRIRAARATQASGLAAGSSPSS